MSCHEVAGAGRWLSRTAVVGLILISAGGVCSAATLEANIAAIKAVGSEGKGHSAAIAAMKELSGGSADSLIPLLQSFDDAGPLATNWLRGAVDAVADRELKSKKQLPAAQLETFIKDTNRRAEARRLAYEWLIKVDPTATDRLIPGMIKDASPEFRRDAVQRLIKSATAAQEEKQQEQALKLYREALAGAVDDDQVKAIVTPLREMGQTVDLQKHFGFLTEWSIAGPFDNTALKGFDTVYAPEKAIDLSATYEGKEGPVTWKKVATTDEYGVLNIAKQLSPFKGAVMYATTTFDSDKARPVEFRLGTPNAWKLWVNGKPIFARDEYHRGVQLDQYSVKADLKKGQNVILLKVCQNEQTEEWAQDYKYQIRVCDSTGAAILPNLSNATSQVAR